MRDFITPPKLVNFRAKKVVILFLALATFISVNAQKVTMECCVSNSLQRCFPDNDPRAKVFTPDIQLTYDDYRKYNFSKDAELLYLIYEHTDFIW
jgi:hypothetical protein